MKKITKTVFIALLTLVMLCVSIPSFAAETYSIDDSTITPYLSHVNNANLTFSATSSGGYADVKYYGLDSFVKANITIKVQKRFLLVFWNNVEEWSANSTEKYGNFYHVFTLNGSGTYRATMTLTITGADGTVDTITDTIESKY